MPLFIFAIAAGLTFIAADAVMIPFVMRPLFKAHLGPQMLDSLRLAPAGLFYVIHLAGLTYFAGRNAARGARPSVVAVDGAVLGLVAYSCYEMTSWTIMRDWSATLVVVDVAWGVVISAIAVAAGAVAARKFAW